MKRCRAIAVSDATAHGMPVAQGAGIARYARNNPANSLKLGKISDDVTHFYISALTLSAPLSPPGLFDNFCILDVVQRPDETTSVARRQRSLHIQSQHSAATAVARAVLTAGGEVEGRQLGVADQAVACADFTLCGIF